MGKFDKLTAALPGGISITHLRVYDTIGPDGLRGGSPHLHFACAEAYLVIAGNGAVQTLCEKGFREIPLRSGSVVWFTPGLIHRLINHDSRLEIYAVMENAGLPEQGDSILIFPPEYLKDESAYLAAASLSPTGAVFANNEEAAARRRDLAVDGFLALRRAFAKNGPDALHDFYRQAVRLIKSKEADWRRLWRSGPEATIRRTEAYLNALAGGSEEYLSNGTVYEIPIDLERETRKFGFCGTLRPYLPEGVLG
ncbi:MAG: cupin [Verrucomicrobia bacterium]|nr:cupin [Verrucomicrobiota bacterium]MBV9274010.1 cupin [Verrucomicrobiota bacterium]